MIKTRLSFVESGRFFNVDRCPSPFAIENKRMADRCAISTRAYRLVVTITLLLVGCATVKVTGQRALGAVPTGPPSVIYVSDFTFSAQGVSAECGIPPISLVNEAAGESSIVFSRIFGVYGSSVVFASASWPI